MKSYTSNNPEFSENIIIPETTDTNHADNINSAPKQLLQNTLENRSKILEVLEKLSNDDDLIEVDITDYTSIATALNENASGTNNSDKVIKPGNYYYTNNDTLKGNTPEVVFRKNYNATTKLPFGAGSSGVILVRRLKYKKESANNPYFICFLISDENLFISDVIPRILVNAYTGMSKISWRSLDSIMSSSEKAKFASGSMLDEYNEPIIDEETGNVIINYSVGDTVFASSSATVASNLDQLSAPGVYYIEGLDSIELDVFMDLPDGILTVFRYDKESGIAKFRQTIQGTDSRHVPRTIVRDGWLDYDTETLLPQYTEWVDAAVENPLKEIKKISPSSLTGFQKFAYGGTSCYAGISFPSAYHFCEGFCCTLTFGKNWKKIRRNPFELKINVSELNGYLSLCRGCLKGSTYSIEEIKLDEMTININNFCQLSSGTLGDSTHQHEGTAVFCMQDGKNINIPISVRIDINDQADQFHMFVYVYFNQMALGAVFDGTCGGISGKLPLFTYLSNLGDYTLPMFNNTSSYTLRFYE